MGTVTGTDLAPPCPHCSGTVCQYELCGSGETYRTLRDPAPEAWQEWRAVCRGCGAVRTYVRTQGTNATATEIRTAHAAQRPLDL